MDGLLNILLALGTATAVGLLLKPAWPRAEAIVRNALLHHRLRRSLPASHYHVLRDIAAGGGDGQSALAAPIDHVVVSPYGIFVIIALHGSGAVTGSKGAPEWVRRRFRARIAFPNPLRQNELHIRALSERLGLPVSSFQSLVVFTGKSDFTAPMPVNVTQPGGVIPFIQVRTRELLDFPQAERVADLLRQQRPKPGIEVVAAHLAALRETQGARFGARQATLGLALMATLLLATGGLIYRLAEVPGKYPSIERTNVPGPFVEQSPPPQIDLPATSGPQPRTGAGRPGVPDDGERYAVSTDSTRSSPTPGAPYDQRATEASLLCAYSVESRRCACYEPEGRKVELDYERCRRLADWRSNSSPR